MGPAAPARPLRVLLVGAGGIGCPAAWGLVRAGGAEVTLLDPDVVEPSNLPRQVLYAPGDVGRPKAVVAAERLGAGAHGVPERLDERNAERWIGAADVVIDATDGARTKDWLNLTAVRLGRPLVHAAGLRGEARVLGVRAGGRPCLACLFGRLEQEAGTCADLGVFGPVVAVAGFRAAQEAHALAAGVGGPAHYEVLDLLGGRAVRLEVGADPGCPVCSAGPPALEPYPAAEACAAPAPAAEPAPAAAHRLDLTTERCPLNLLRARQALEALAPGEVAEFWLGAEGAGTVPAGLRRLGHEVLSEEPRGAGLRLLARRARRVQRAEPLAAALLARFARQIVLPDVGEAGQRRLLKARVEVHGAGDALASAAALLAAAGVGGLWLVSEGPPGPGPGGADLLAFLAARAVGEVRPGAAPAAAHARRVSLPAAGPGGPLAELLAGAHAAQRVLLALLGLGPRPDPGAPPR